MILLPKRAREERTSESKGLPREVGVADKQKMRGEGASKQKMRILSVSNVHITYYNDSY